MDIPPPSQNAVKVTLIVFHSVAFLTTVLRLGYRAHTRRLWFDDLWAFIALLCDMFVWILFASVGGDVFSLANKSQGVKLFWVFGTLIGYSVTLWAARISIATTIVRLVADGPFRRCAKAMVYVFFALFLGLAIQKIFFCGTRWDQVYACPIPRWTAYLQLATDIFGDLWLLFAPVYMMRNMRLSSPHRRLINAIFSTGILSSFASIALAYFIIVESPFYIGLISHVQLGFSILLCNLLVLVTFVYRVFANQENGQQRPRSPKSPVDTRPQMVTVDRNLQTGERAEETAVSITDLGSNFGNTQRSGNFNQGPVSSSIFSHPDSYAKARGEPVYDEDSLSPPLDTISSIHYRAGSRHNETGFSSSSRWGTDSSS